MAGRRVRGRNDGVNNIISAVARDYGKGSWTVSDLKKKQVQVEHGLIAFMHGEGLIRKTGMKPLPTSGYVSSWALTAKAMMRVK